MTKLLIFDFDGTLADTKKVWFDSIVSILKKENIYCPECEAKIMVHFGRKISDVLDELELNKKEIKTIRDKIHALALSKANTIKLCPKAKWAAKMNIKKIIVSNSNSKFINKVLIKNRIKGEFKSVYGGEMFGEKPELLKNLFKKYKIRPKYAAYIGDRAGDVKVAEKAGCISIIVSNKYSWNSRIEIIKQNPDFIIGSLGELKTILLGNNHIFKQGR